MHLYSLSPALSRRERGLKSSSRPSPQGEGGLRVVAEKEIRQGIHVRSLPLL